MTERRAIMKILVLHGPNLNMLGTREPEIYGSMTLSDINTTLMELGKEFGADLKCFQSNHEGALIDALAGSSSCGQTVCCSTPVDILIPRLRCAMPSARLEFLWSKSICRMCMHVRNSDITSMISAVCKGKIVGFGWRSYTLALRALVEILTASEVVIKQRAFGEIHR